VDPDPKLVLNLTKNDVLSKNYQFDNYDIKLN
jgi:hypothetical protein